MLEPHSGVHVHRGVCSEAWMEATERQRIEWAVRLFRRQQSPGAFSSPASRRTRQAEDRHPYPGRTVDRARQGRLANALRELLPLVQGLTILVVDDDEFVRDATRLLLEDAGARVLTARDGADALLQ